MSDAIDTNDLVYRLRKRAEIRRQISTRKSVQEGARDRISDLLEEAARELDRLRGEVERLRPALARAAASNHLARHPDASASDWERCQQASCRDAQAALDPSKREG